jgi:apolipoprotein D and lipocalin family protein
MSADAELQQRIGLAEQRVVARDAALQQHWIEMRRHWQQRLEPRRWLKPALAGGAGLGLLWWITHRRPPSPRYAATSSAAKPAPRTAPWVHAIGLVWPLLPAQWRARISPGTAAALASVGLPLLERLVARPQAPPRTMPQVDLRRFMGDWYEVARLPAPFEGACAGQPSAHYRLRRSGSVEVVNRCRGADGREKVSVGRAVVVPGSGNAQLRISLWPRALRFLSWAWSDFWIVHVDPQYRMALVAHPSRRWCWLLSRERELAPADMARLLEIAAAEGFAVQRLQQHPPQP